MADSLHEALLASALTRLNALALTRPDSTVMPWLEREILSQDWTNSLSNLPCGILSAVGIEQEIAGQSDTCVWEDGFPLTVRIIDRGSAWDAVPRNWRLKVREDIKRAFRGVPLTFTYTGALCVDVLFLPSPTLEILPEGYRVLSSPLFFQVNASQLQP